LPPQDAEQTLTVFSGSTIREERYKPMITVIGKSSAEVQRKTFELEMPVPSFESLGLLSHRD
jgi:hypothetical protein